MGQNSAIEWCHHTFNAWWGCTNISPACDNCYAETWSKRCGKDVWGKDSPREGMSDHYWKQPLKWDRLAEEAGERHRVFCASMSDVFEDRADLNVHRDRLWDLIESTPQLDWLLLTKRPSKIGKLAPYGKKGREWPRNIWLGTTVEMQRFARVRIPQLLKHDAAVHFVSAEPLLEKLNLRKYLVGERHINWVIGGGETNSDRPMHLEWVRSLRDQCDETGVSFLFKQWGDHNENLIKLGKKKTGRHLDGRTHDDFPVPRGQTVWERLRSA